MQDHKRTRQQLISELETVRQRIAELERAEKHRNLVEELANAARIYGESIFSTVREPLLVLDSDLRVVSANRSFYLTFRVTPQGTENTLIYELGDYQWDIPQLRSLLEDIVPNNTEFENFEVCHDFPNLGHRKMLLNARRVDQESGQPMFILLAMEDVTDRKRAEEALRESEKRYRALYDDNPSMFFTVDFEGRVLSANHFGAEQLGYCVEELVGMPLAKLYLKSEKASVREHLETCIRNPETVQRREFCKVRKNGTMLWVRETARTAKAADGKSTVLIVCEDITDLHKLSEQLSYHASHDPLTGLVNRRTFEDCLERVLATAAAGEGTHAICYMDLDRFKIINDTCSHSAGDEFLRQLGGLFLEHVRKTDTLARLGGDEFGVLMEHCSLQQARRLSNSLRKATEDFRFRWEDKSFSIGVSIGLVPITKNSGNVAQILQEVDAACYLAKDAGGNGVHVRSPDAPEVASQSGEVMWVAPINMALEQNRFQLSFQPIAPIENPDDEGAHYELLIQMEDEQGHIVPPGSFLPAAERYSLATKIDRWVIATAFRWLADHPEHLEHLYLCAINLSGHSLGDEDFLEFAVRQFDEGPIRPEKICFEVTETAAIANLTSASKFIQALNVRGCRFALDDFGSGLSSFAYLKNLPVDFLKIDGTFVKNIVDDPVDLAMVKSINELGHVLGKKTIAEFVEKESILGMLRELGVDYAQGYHIGRPQPIEKMDR
jgi:diguanylate cyclase (GGDEF)-like protein/PAS domain S-box-containing protein